MKDESSSCRPGPRYGALLDLLRVAESVWEASRVFFAQWDLSPSQFNILHLLRNSPGGLSQTELSRSLITHRSNVTGLVDRLEQRGLLLRREDSGDRRAYRVVLTTEGSRLLESILPGYFEAIEELWGDIPASRAVQIVEALSSLHDRAPGIAGRVRKT